jgi:hypothetical protein
MPSSPIKCSPPSRSTSPTRRAAGMKSRKAKDRVRPVRAVRASLRLSFAKPQ